MAGKEMNPHPPPQYLAPYILQVLIELGGQLDTRDRHGATPLFCACFSGHADLVALLLAKGADPFLGNAAGEVPLYIAALRGHLRAVECLLAHLEAHQIPWQVGLGICAILCSAGRTLVAACSLQ